MNISLNCNITCKYYNSANGPLIQPKTLLPHTLKTRNHTEYLPCPSSLAVTLSQLSGMLNLQIVPQNQPTLFVKIPIKTHRTDLHYSYSQQVFRRKAKYKWFLNFKTNSKYLG